MCQVRILLLLTVAALAQGAVPLKIAIGDMFMTFKQYMLRYTNDTTIKRNGLIDKRYRWPGGIVPVIIAPQFSANDVTTIKAAAAEISRGTCVKFQFDVNPRSHPIHVKINKIGSGLCSADIGYVKQATKINLDPVRCKKGSIIHEMLHVLGFYHMQEAAERDNYININFNNIDPKRKDQFKKSNQVTLFNTPYDISSIMHYSSKAWAINRDIPVMTAKNGKAATEMGQRNKMTDGDFERVNRMYECPGRQ